MSQTPEGLLYLPGFVSETEEQQLLAAMEQVAFREVQMRGQVARRTTAHFGWDYGYESWALTPAPPIPPFLLPLRARCAQVADLPPEGLEEVLLSRYPPGAGIGWHRDAPLFGPSVIGVSLGGPARMRLRLQERGGTTATHVLELAPRSCYVLSGEARTRWQHTLSPVKTLRYSITFRTLRAPRMQSGARAAPVRATPTPDGSS